MMGAVGEFSFPPIAPLCYPVACKRSRSFCQQCRWQITAKRGYILDPTKLKWADYYWLGIVLEPVREMSSHASGNTCSWSSQLTESLWTYPWPKSGLVVIIFKGGGGVLCILSIAVSLPSVPVLTLSLDCCREISPLKVLDSGDGLEVSKPPTRHR